MASDREVLIEATLFPNCLAKASIEDFRWHDLRHTFASRLRRNGIPLEDIALLLDHGIPELRMTLRYAHPDMDRVHKAVATLVPKTNAEQTQTGTKTSTSPVTIIPMREAV